ncbi:hypothetical protein H310_00506 [Aphanomyces invadans]|uniref:Chromatin assembly factor 1 subunit A dimerization domain-containing protein n=1 Tax=Aphanomyces invadans TaxID=157072 RepID=A0A024UUV5_9STRA|nr:hypothetical protein H310_00506 [Aphanomyces invadans]ETW10134.1 hypothetical protein H310_00506 [Aphanomyces invadans]|eukprot:XP_008861545.1 hypothetical protein H310_00506 [Aphanomyces invadans]
MTTPEKRKQASIASFFSPVSRNVAPGVDPVPTTTKNPPVAIAEAKESSPPGNNTDTTANPPLNIEGMQTKPSKRKIKLSDTQSAIQLDKLKDDQLTKSSPTFHHEAKKDDTEMLVSCDTVPPKMKKRKTKAPANALKTPNAQAQLPAPTPDSTTLVTPARVTEAPSVSSVKGTAKTDVITIDDSDDNSVNMTPSDTAEAKTKKSRPQRVATTTVHKPNEPAEVKPPARKRSKAAASPEAPPAVVKPALSGILQQKHELYLQKLTDVEQLFVALTKGKNKDELLQEIYGAHVDIGLNLTTEFLAACREELTAECKSITTAWASVPVVAKSFIARRIQGCMDSLSTLADKIQSEWLEWLNASSEVACFNASMVEMEIKSMAERVSYGAKSKKAHMFQDTTPRAMWVWEVGAIESYFDDDAVKIIRRVRKQRKRTGQAIKTLDKIATMILEDTTDDSKLSLEEGKVSKFFVAVEQEIQKAQKRGEHEKQKALEKDLKAQQQMEKEEAKRMDQELKRKEKEDTKKKQEALAKEKEEQELLRRRQTWGTFLKKTETKPSNDISRDRTVLADSNMERIDQELGLGMSKDGTGPKNPPAISLTTGTAPQVPVQPGSWSSQRHRHPTLGIKKLLQFHDNYRPAYWGTNSKKARVLRRGRRPFAMVASLDYTVESDLEWEDDEMGESLSGKDSDDENGDEEDRLDYGDQWLAYEDEVDYIDERPAEDFDGPPATTHKKVAEHHHRPSKLVKLIPRIIEQVEDLAAYTIVVLLDQPNFVSPLLKVTPPVAEEVVELPPAEPAPLEVISPPVKPSGITTWLKPKPT